MATLATLAVLLIIAGCAAYQYLNGTIFKALTTIIIAICASIVAFGYFELSADFFISRGSNSRFPALVPWAQPLCFTLLFVLTFAILQTAAMLLTKLPVDFGFIPERVGRAICGIFLGFILSGLLLTALAMSPLPNKYPYQRFDRTNLANQTPNKVFPNADGFITGWFSLLSKGSFRAIRNPRSFATLHPAFLDQIFLNRHNDSGDVPLVTSAESIDIPRKRGEKGEAGAWYAPPAGFKDADGKAITPQKGQIVVVRMGIKKNAVRDAGTFTLSQLRLICKQKDSADGPLAGKGINVYPIGYFDGPNRIKTKKLSEQITIGRDDFASQDTRKYVDFAFDVPNGHTPVLLEFKLNNIAEVPRPVPAGQAPATIPFIERAKPKPEATTPDQSRPDYPSRQDDSTDSSRRRPRLTLTRPIAPVGLDDDE